MNGQKLLKKVNRGAEKTSGKNFKVPRSSLLAVKQRGVSKINDWHETTSHEYDNGSSHNYSH